MPLSGAVLVIFCQRIKFLFRGSHVRFCSHLLKKNRMKNFIIHVLYVTKTFIYAIKAHFKSLFTTLQ